ncbi:hypothetical protein Ahy_B09g099615 [Arachis hypogaea]|uniref:Uncharacterized protein n=1 Tax=Arachis hypogaea TaxID=3818 RepID=A0A444XV85_ARAHY|nr:hypothetical protein Ahy_B09g099615 [Arachis hypogaea]
MKEGKEVRMGLMHVDASSSQPGSSPNPTVVESPAPSNPTMPPAPTRVKRSTLIISPPGPTATQTRPPAPTIGRPFKPPGKANDTSRPQQSRFRPKQKIFRPPTPIAASTINTNTQQQPHLPSHLQLRIKKLHPKICQLLQKQRTRKNEDYCH